MIDSTIPGEILNGKLIEIDVSPTPNSSRPLFEAQLREVEPWLRQFKKNCGAQGCLYFSEHSNSEGHITLRVTIGIIPDNRRKELAQKLQTLADNAPFEIKLRTQNP